MFCLMLTMFHITRVLFMYYWENNFESIDESYSYIPYLYMYMYITTYEYAYYRIVKYLNHITIVLQLIALTLLLLRYFFAILGLFVFRSIPCSSMFARDLGSVPLVYDSGVLCIDRINE